MPKKKNYPKDFNPHYEPAFYGSEPKKTITYHKTLKSIELHYEDVILPEHVGFIISEIDDSYIILEKKEEVVKNNPGFDLKLAQYKKAKKEREEKVKEWKVWKRKWDAEKEEENKKHELAQLAALKKKYE